MRRSEKGNNKGRKMSISIPSSSKLEQTERSSSVMKVLSQKSVFILAIIGVTVAIVVSYYIYINSANAIQNLINSDAETIKNALTSNTPCLFYCHRGEKDETVPSLFTQLQAVKGSKMGFAVVNCSTELPSGKNLWNRFQLKKDIKPTIFETAPWTKPTQVSRKELKDLSSLKNFVEKTMAPRGVAVVTDKELTKQCGFHAANKTTRTDTNSRGETCIVLVKGSKYSKLHAEMEEKIVRANPKLKIITVDAVKKRLSFEDTHSLPADMFSLKLHALRNATHYISMVTPTTWDYVSSFISQSVSFPTYSYSGDYKSNIKLLKTGSSDFKSRSSNAPSNLPTVKKNKQSSPQSLLFPLNKESAITGSSREGGNNAKNDLSPEIEQQQDTVAEKFSREKRRRDEMERQYREHLFEDENGQEIEDSNDEEEENVIEL